MSNITLTPKQQEIFDDVIDKVHNHGGRSECVLVGYAGTGKAQPIDTKTPTPNGVVDFGDLKVGDYVFGSNGTPTKVIGVYPQGMKQTYTISFRDGTKTKACAEHNWTVLNKKNAKYTLTTEELIKKGITNSAGSKYKVPLANAVEYTEQQHIIDPYILGLLIGNGYLVGHSAQVSIAHKDNDIKDRIEALLSNTNMKITSENTSENVSQYVISGMIGEIKRLQLNVKSGMKFIPDEYMFDSIVNRTKLLQGIMDSDGSCCKNRTSLSTTSKQLSLDFESLIQSLGSVCIVHEYEGSRYKSNYYAEIYVKSTFNPFMCLRKSAEWKYSDKNPPSKYITSIEKSDVLECVCIMVEAEDSLYLTNNYIVTHNTTLVAEIVENLCKGLNIAVTSPTHKANSVIRNMLIKNVGLSSDDAQVSTIHSFLGLKLVYEKSRQVLKHDPQSKNSTSMVDVLIVDECSMISEELYQHIKDQMFRVRRAIIFVGDSCQLPPVEAEGTIGETKLSPTFKAETKYELTEVLRQALDNPIISIATAIRECIGTKSDPLSILDTTYGLDTIIPIDDEDVFLEVYKQMICDSTGLERDEDGILRDSKGQVRSYRQESSKIFDFVQENKILAYTNFRVNLANIYMRSTLFDDPNELVKGEPIVFDTVTENCPYMNQEIIKCPEVRKDQFMGIDCWQLRLPNGNFLYAVGPESRIAMEAKLDELVKKIERKDYSDELKRVYTWQDYYIIKNKINVINYPYATTVHKSQGSTFDKIWFDTDFIERIRLNDTKCRIIYTAITRPREYVMFRKNGMF